MKEIVRIDPNRAAKVAAAAYFIISLVVVVLFGVFGMVIRSFSPDAFPLSMGFLFVVPVLYTAIAAIFTWLGCMFYNWLVKYTGGIRFKLADSVEVKD